MIPVGGGGLIAGVACAVKETQSEDQGNRRADFEAAFDESGARTAQAGDAARRTRRSPTASRCAARATSPFRSSKNMWTMSSPSTTKRSPTRFSLLLEKEKTLTEGAGAVAAAAVLNQKIPLRGKKLGVLISGGNIDVTLLSRIIERGLVKDGRLLRIRIHLPDHPGALQRLATVIADHKANIIETRHDRAYYGVVLGDTVIDITMETRGPDHIAEIEAALDAAGYPHERVQ